MLNSLSLCNKAWSLSLSLSLSLYIYIYIYIYIYYWPVLLPTDMRMSWHETVWNPQNLLCITPPQQDLAEFGVSLISDNWRTVPMLAPCQHAVAVHKGKGRWCDNNLTERCGGGVFRCINPERKSVTDRRSMGHYADNCPYLFQHSLFTPPPPPPPPRQHPPIHQTQCTICEDFWNTCEEM